MGLKPPTTDLTIQSLKTKSNTVRMFLMLSRVFPWNFTRNGRCLAVEMASRRAVSFFFPLQSPRTLLCKFSSLFHFLLPFFLFFFFYTQQLKVVGCPQRHQILICLFIYFLFFCFIYLFIFGFFCFLFLLFWLMLVWSLNTSQSQYILVPFHHCASFILLCDHILWCWDSNKQFSLPCR